jgi:hypothetical protein
MNGRRIRSRIARCAAGGLAATALLGAGAAHWVHGPERATRTATPPVGAPARVASSAPKPAMQSASYQIPGLSRDTQDLLNGINSAGSVISGIVDSTVSGRALTPDQRRDANTIIRNGNRASVIAPILGIINRISAEYGNQNEYVTFGADQVDSNGNRWHRDPFSGRWSSPDRPTDSSPPFFRHNVLANP